MNRLLVCNGENLQWVDIPDGSLAVDDGKILFDSNSFVNMLADISIVPNKRNSIGVKETNALITPIAVKSSKTIFVMGEYIGKVWDEINGITTNIVVYCENVECFESLIANGYFVKMFQKYDDVDIYIKTERYIMTVNKKCFIRSFEAGKIIAKYWNVIPNTLPNGNKFFWVDGGSHYGKSYSRDGYLPLISNPDFWDKVEGSLYDEPVTLTKIMEDGFVEVSQEYENIKIDANKKIIHLIDDGTENREYISNQMNTKYKEWTLYIISSDGAFVLPSEKDFSNLDKDWVANKTLKDENGEVKICGQDIRYSKSLIVDVKALDVEIIKKIVENLKTNKLSAKLNKYFYFKYGEEKSYLIVLNNKKLADFLNENKNKIDNVEIIYCVGNVGVDYDMGTNGNIEEIKKTTFGEKHIGERYNICTLWDIFKIAEEYDISSKSLSINTVISCNSEQKRIKIKIDFKNKKIILKHDDYSNHNLPADVKLYFVCGDYRSTDLSISSDEIMEFVLSDLFKDFDIITGDEIVYVTDNIYNELLWRFIERTKTPFFFVGKKDIARYVKRDIEAFDFNYCRNVCSVFDEVFLKVYSVSDLHISYFNIKDGEFCYKNSKLDYLIKSLCDKVAPKVIEFRNKFVEEFKRLMPHPELYAKALDFIYYSIINVNFFISNYTFSMSYNEEYGYYQFTTCCSDGKYLVAPHAGTSTCLNVYDVRGYLYDECCVVARSSECPSIISYGNIDYDNNNHYAIFDLQSVSKTPDGWIEVRIKPMVKLKNEDEKPANSVIVDGKLILK